MQINLDPYQVLNVSELSSTDDITHRYNYLVNHYSKINDSTARCFVNIIHNAYKTIMSHRNPTGIDRIFNNMHGIMESLVHNVPKPNSIFTNQIKNVAKHSVVHDDAHDTMYHHEHQYTDADDYIGGSHHYEFVQQTSNQMHDGKNITHMYQYVDKDGVKNTNSRTFVNGKEIKGNSNLTIQQT